MARRPRRKNKVVDKTVADELGADITPVRQWIQEIDTAKGDFKLYWDRCDEIVRRYKDQDSNRDQRQPGKQPERKYNVLWSIHQTMKPLVYSKAPQPYVSRSFMDKDPIGRDAAMIIQRSLVSGLEDETLHNALKETNDDFLLCGRGVPWAKYTPYMKLRCVECDYNDGDELPEDAELQMRDDGTQFYMDEYEEKVYEECDWEHVHYRHFLHGAASKWKHVPWVARMVPMTRKQQIKRFGEEMGKKAPLTINAKQSKNAPSPSRGSQTRTYGMSDEEKGLFAKAEIWEIWCREDKMVRWVCPDYPDAFLDEQSDLLELERFFPCPQPAFGTKTNESLEPTPDFRMWQDIAMELDEVTFRIKLLTEALRIVGVYDQSMGDIMARVTKQTNENDMIPVSSFAMFAEKGGLKGAIEYFPIEQVANVLREMHAARAQLKQELYEITGISDIVRGASDPRETARAQSIKGEFANKRLGEKQDEMLRVARESMEIQAEIICKHYSVETIRMISSADQLFVDENGIPQPDRFSAAMRLVKDNTIRQFRVKVDEYNLALPDLSENREENMMFLQGVSQFADRAVAAAQQAPAMVPLLGDLLLLGVRSFPKSRSVEASIEAAIEKLKQMPAPPKEEEQYKGKTPEEIEVEREKNRIAFAQVKQREQEAMLTHRRELLKIFATQQNDEKQDANRQVESMLRADKQKSEERIRLLDIAARDEADQRRENNALERWFGDREDKAEDKVIDFQKEMIKIRADLEKAFAANEQKEAA